MAVKPRLDGNETSSSSFKELTAACDWSELISDVNKYLHLRTTPIGMKLYASVEEMEAVPLSIHY